MDAAPLACVIGDMDLVRPLGLAGIRCAVVARPDDPVRYSRFAEARIEWTDPWEDPGALVERLVAFAQALPEPPVLFFEEDRDVLMVARFRERLAEGLRFVVAPTDLVEALVDKGRFRELAERTGLPVPPSARVPADGDPPSDLGLRFPVVVKPLTREGFARFAAVGGSRKALRLETPEALAALWPRLAGAGVELLAQEAVDGAESRIESYHAYVDEHGDVVAEFTGRKIRTRPLEHGFSTALETTESEDVARTGRDVLHRIGLTGVAKADFKRDAEGRLHLLEINPRFTLWNHLGAVGGVNVPALVYADLTGRPRPPAGRVPAGLRWCQPVHDALAARESGVPLHRWLPWALRSDALSVAALDDPAPIVRGVLWRHARRALRRG